MIVVDTNAVVHFLLRGPETARMELLRAKDGRWIAPALLRYELLNVLCRYIHLNLMSRDDATRTYRRGLSVVEIDETIPDPVKIFNLHLVSGCSSYDCQFLAMAEDLNLKLVTLVDQQILRFFPSVAFPPESI